MNNNEKKAKAGRFENRAVKKARVFLIKSLDKKFQPKIKQFKHSSYIH